MMLPVQLDKKREVPFIDTYFFSVLTVILLIFGILIGAGNSQNDGKFDIQTKLEEYVNKLSNNEATCDMVYNTPALSNWTVFPYRNCMCDDACPVYKDCCKDSAYYNKTEQLQKSTFHCHPKEEVYLIATCPSSSGMSVRAKCEKSQSPANDLNLKLFIPVTNRGTNITYGNEYCAICNQDYSYDRWNSTVTCSKTEVGLRPIIDNNFEIPLINLNDAKIPFRYNPTSESFFSSYEGTTYECKFALQRPEFVIPHLNKCVPAISSCSRSDDKLQTICASYTAYVYDDNYRVYKNDKCAKCNEVVETSPFFQSSLLLRGTHSFTGSENPRSVRERSRSTTYSNTQSKSNFNDFIQRRNILKKSKDSF